MTTMSVVGECFFWYRLAQIVMDKGPWSGSSSSSSLLVNAASAVDVFKSSKRLEQACQNSDNSFSIGWYFIGRPFAGFYQPLHALYVADSYL